MAENQRASTEKLTINFTPCLPTACVVPGHFPRVAIGRLEDASGTLSLNYIRLVRDIGCNVAQGNLASFGHYKASLENARKEGIRVIIRLGNEKLDLSGTAYPFNPPTSASMEALAKIKPDNPYWSSAYGHLTDEIGELLRYGKTCEKEGKENPLDSLVGFALADQPRATEMWNLRRSAEMIWELYRKNGYDSTPFIYANLYGNLVSGAPSEGVSADLEKYAGGMNKAAAYLSGYTPIRSYSDYVDLHMLLSKPSVLSFDSYPFREHENQKQSAMRCFFTSLIVMGNKTMAGETQFWSTILCRRVKTTSGDRDHGSPTLGRMRFAAYVSICYGASGLSYWGMSDIPASGGEQFSESPLKPTGEPTPTFFNVQKLNREIASFEDILLTSVLKEVVVTKVPPHLTLAITPGLKLMSSAGFGLILSIEDTTVEEAGSGFVLSRRDSANESYILVASMDGEKTQSANFTIGPVSLVDYIEIDNGGPNGWVALPNNLRPKTIALTFAPGAIKIFRVRSLSTIIP